MHLEVVVDRELPDTIIKVLVVDDSIRDLVTSTGQGSSTTTTFTTNTSIPNYTISIGTHVYYKYQ